MPAPDRRTLVDDLSDPSPWRFVSDRVMGGVSSGQAEAGRDPAHVRLTGDVSTDNNGGFIQVRRDLGPWPVGTERVILTVRGDGQTYFAALRTSDATRPWHSYRAAFTAPADWAQVTIPIAAFAATRPEMPPLRLDRLRSIGLLAYGRDHRADLSLARIEIA
ncbi:MAG: CIA30 family protein [Rhodobacteraceae bacterium]|nr:MAG: CIA30 family protein [Paracoccaceae bacterium]